MVTAVCYPRRMECARLSAVLALFWLGWSAEAPSPPPQPTPFWGSDTVYGNYSGDLLLGALFPVHQMGQSDAHCGRIQASPPQHDGTW